MTPRPWELLPAPLPKTSSYPEDFFYTNVAKPLIADTVRLMANGLPVDLTKVQELEDTLDEVLTKVRTSIGANPIIKEYLASRYKSSVEAYKQEQLGKMKTYEHFLKAFSHKDMNHRSYFMHIFCRGKHIQPPEALLPTGIPKWTVNDVKKLLPSYPALSPLVSGAISASNTIALEAMELLAQHKAETYNKTYEDNIKHLTRVQTPEFNPASSDQKHDVLTGILGYESSNFTDAYLDYQKQLKKFLRYGKNEPVEPKNKYSWSRDDIKELFDLARNEDEKQLFQDLFDYSMGAIIKNNFIKAFYEHTHDGRLYGEYVLLGAKSGRYTSKAPNLLNMPSTKSIYAKPVKECFVAPPGYVVWTIDYAALEDRVLTNLTRDPGKLAIYDQDLDGHSYNTIGYWPDKCNAIVPLTGDQAEDAKAFQKAVDDGNKEAKALRQDSKPITFKLAYLGMADNHKGGVITPEIYENYHTTLYPNIMKQVKEYIIPTVTETKELHCGLGFKIRSDRPETDVRTLNNALNQFWSILTAIGINELHHRIDETFVSSDTVQVTSTIYDSIYGICLADPEVIHWLNENIVEILTKDFVEGQLVKNEANLEIGLNWANTHNIDNGASLEDITKLLEDIL